MKQLVAINQMSAAMIASKAQTLRQHFDSEEELQDLLTKRMLEQQIVNDDENDLGEGDALAMGATTGGAAKAWTSKYALINDREERGEKVEMNLFLTLFWSELRDKIIIEQIFNQSSA